MKFLCLLNTDSKMRLFFLLPHFSARRPPLDFSSSLFMFLDRLEILSKMMGLVPFFLSVMLMLPFCLIENSKSRS